MRPVRPTPCTMASDARSTSAAAPTAPWRGTACACATVSAPRTPRGVRRGTGQRRAGQPDALLAPVPSRFRWSPRIPIRCAWTSPADFAHDFAAVVDSSLGLVYRYGMKIAGAGAAASQQAMSVCGGPSTSAGIMHRIAAIWNRPAIQAGQAGAALGAAVAAAVALVSDGDRDELAERLRQAIFAGKPVVAPDPELVRAYHAPGAYLDQLRDRLQRTGRAIGENGLIRPLIVTRVAPSRDSRDRATSGAVCAGSAYTGARTGLRGAQNALPSPRRCDMIPNVIWTLDCAGGRRKVQYGAGGVCRSYLQWPLLVRRIRERTGVSLIKDSDTSALGANGTRLRSRCARRYTACSSSCCSASRWLSWPRQSVSMSTGMVCAVARARGTRGDLSRYGEVLSAALRAPLWELSRSNTESIVRSIADGTLSPSWSWNRRASRPLSKSRQPRRCPARRCNAPGGSF